MPRITPTHSALVDLLYILLQDHLNAPSTIYTQQDSSKESLSPSVYHINVLLTIQKLIFYVENVSF